ncbi:MAG: flagellar basal body L-ring protein FlgH [bacterium]
MKLSGGRKDLLSGLVFIFLAGVVTPGQAISLWSERSNYFIDHKARQPGDIITVLITESSNATHAASTKRDKDVSVDGGPTSVTKNLLDFLPFFGGKAKSAYKGSGSTTRRGALTATISCRVVKVLPNGNLSIEGSKNIRVNSEEEEIILSGVIRPEDISSDNTIPSTYVSEANVRYKGGLTFSDQEKPGLFKRVLAGIANFCF